MDGLEKYVQQHREEFDQAVPDLKVWGAITRELNGATPVRRLPWYRRTRLLSAVAALIFAGVLGVYWCQPHGPVSDAPATTPRAIAAADPEVAEMEAFYQARFEEGYAQLAALRPEPAVQRDLQQMDAALAELRVELADAPVEARAAIVEAMIQHHKTKLELLEYILTQLRAATPDDLNEANDDAISI